MIHAHGNNIADGTYADMLLEKCAEIGWIQFYMVGNVFDVNIRIIVLFDKRDSFANGIWILCGAIKQVDQRICQSGEAFFKIFIAVVLDFSRIIGELGLVLGILPQKRNEAGKKGEDKRDMRVPAVTQCIII